jgi:hypothetical protein
MSALHTPNLEQYKKQAKDLLKAHRSGDAESLALLREHSPRLNKGSDEEILAYDLSLQEAQHVIACRHSYRNWDWLRIISTCDFDQLAQLDDREVQMHLHWCDHQSLLQALKGIENTPVATRFLENMSSRVRAEVEREIAALTDVDPERSEEIRGAILTRTMRKVNEEEITWPKEKGGATPRTGSPYSPRLLELAALPLEQMDTEQIAELFAEMARRAQQHGAVSLHGLEEKVANPFIREGLQLTVDATEPDLVEEMLKTRSRFALLPQLRTHRMMIVEGTMSMVSNDPPRILHHKLSTFYEAEQREIWSEYQEVDVTELIDRLRRTPFAEMKFDQIDSFFTDMATLWLRSGIKGLKPLIEVASYPMLRLAFELVCADIDHDELCERLEAHLEEEMQQIKLCHHMVIAGIRAVWDLKSPEEVTEIVEEVGSRAG